MKDGKCTDPSCKLQHVEDIGSLRKGPSSSVEEWKTTAAKKSEPKPATKESKSSAFSIIESKEDSSFKESFTIRKGALMALEKKKNVEEESKKKLKSQMCKFLFEKGSCRMGDKCFYSHDISVSASTPSSVPSRGGRGGRGGMRGMRLGGERRPMTAFPPPGLRSGTPDSSEPFPPSSLPSREYFRGARGGRGGRGGRDDRSAR